VVTSVFDSFTPLANVEIDLKKKKKAEEQEDVND